MKEEKMKKIRWWDKDAWTGAKYRIKVPVGTPYSTKDGSIVTKSEGTGYIYEEDLTNPFG